MLDNKLPSVVEDTIGYHSENGFLNYNGKSQGNMMGKKYTRGDAVGIEMEVFEKDMSVALFSKNFRPGWFIMNSSQYSFLINSLFKLAHAF